MSKKISHKFGSKINAQRKKQGLTLEDLAKLSGTTKSYIWELENKPYSRPSAEKVFSIASALNTTADYLMGYSDNQEAADKAFFKQYLELDDKGKQYIRAITRSYEKYLKPKGENDDQKRVQQ